MTSRQPSLSVSDRPANPALDAEQVELQAEREPFSEPADSPLDEQPRPTATKKPERSEPELRDEHLFELDDEPLATGLAATEETLGPLARLGPAEPARRERPGRAIRDLSLRRAGASGPVPPLVRTTVPGHRLPAAVQGRYQPESRAATWWCAAILSSAARW